MHMQKFPDEKLWPRLLSRKLGGPAMNDFVAWYDILSKIDVDYILDHGTLKDAPTAGPKVTAEVAARMAEFAAVFAVADRINKKLSPNHKGLETFCLGLAPELQVAFLLQLQEKVKNAFRKSYPNAAGQIMGNIIKDSA